MKTRTVVHRSTRAPFVAAAVIAGIFGTMSTAAAHDFWVIPDVFVSDANATMHASGRSGLRFPTGSAVQPARVADARLIGERGAQKITELSVEGGSLRMHQKPEAAGQYLIAVSLTPRTTRSTPTGLLRFLRLEGGAAEAARLEQDNVLGSADSLEYRSTSYGFAIVQVGRGGGRVFGASAGFPLEFKPVGDPSILRMGDTLHLRIVGGRQPVQNATVDAVAAADSSATAEGPGAAMRTFAADAHGVIHVPLHAAGAWSLRAAYVMRRADSSSGWDVARATYVFGVAGHH